MELGLQRDYLLGQHRSDVTRQRKAGGHNGRGPCAPACVQLFAKTKAATRKPANSGLFGKNQEVSMEELG